MAIRPKTSYRVVLKLAVDRGIYAKPDNWDWWDLLNMAPDEVEVVQVEEVFDERPA